MDWSVAILIILGMVLSWYAWHVEQYAGKKKNYAAACDISERVSCTKAFTSTFGKTFGISNSIYGMIGYFVLLVLALMGEIQYVFVLAVFACLVSIYLAYLQYAKVKTFCVVCTCIYLINIVIVGISAFRLFY